MKIGLFSDVHGNLDAFRAVLATMQAERLDHYVFCGDLCGYYYDQNEIVALMKTLQPLTAVRGNHDAWFLAHLDDENSLNAYTQRYGSSNRRLKIQASTETKEFLRSLPEQAEIKEIGALVTHGSPWDALNEYIYPTTSLDRFSNLPYRWVFLGHSHYAMHRQAGPVQIVNPGSCGQPRDHQDASFAIVDSVSGAVRIQRVRYDQAPVLKQIQAYDPEVPYLSEVLRREAKISL